MPPIEPQQISASLLLYNKMITKMRRLLNVVGMDFLNPDFQVGANIIVVNGHILVFLVLYAYTIWMTYNDAEEMLKCMCTFGVPIRLAFMTNRMTAKRDEINVIHQHVLWLHTNSLGRYQEVLLRWTNLSSKVFGFQTAIYLVGTHSVVLFPIICYVLYGDKVLILTILVPGLDLQEWSAFLPISIFELNCTYISFFVLLPADMYFVLNCLMTCAHMEMSRLRCEHFNRDLVAWEAKSRQPMRADKRRRHRRQIYEKLMACIVAGKRADELLDTICTCFEDICGVQLAVAGVALALCILAGRLTTWPMAFPLGFTFFFVMCENAVLGSLIERQGDQLAQAVYEMPWYLLPVAEQKIVMFMLLNWQRIRCVSVFGSSKLNVATVQAIMKTIYSGYMMLDSTL